MFVNSRQSLGLPVDVAIIAKVAPEVYKSRPEVVVDDDDDWDFEGAVGLDEVELVGVKWCFCGLHEFCCTKRRKVPRTFAEAVKPSDETGKPGDESEAQATNGTTPLVQSAVKSEIVSLSASLETAAKRRQVLSPKWMRCVGRQRWMLRSVMLF